MAIASNFPSIKPSLNLDFANVKRLDPRITFTRASTGTYYDGVTTAKAEENLLLQSQDFTTTWVNTQTTDTANAEVAPDGTTTADTIADTAVASVHDIAQTISAATNVTYAYSCFLKNGTRQYAILAASTSANSWVGAKFDLSSGTAGSTSSAGSIFSLVSSSITSIGSGWYRCTLIFNYTTAATLALRVGLATDSTTFTAGERGLESYTGDGSTIYAWGAQLEQRSAVTAYTATTTQTITNYIPVLLTAAAGVARFDHNPTTDESLGLLIEEQRTNSLTYSADFADAAWTKTDSSITSNTIVAPDGTLTGDKLVENTANATHSVATGSISFTSGTSYTLSVYAKAAERTVFSIIRSGTGGASARFDLSTLTATNLVGTSALSITAVGNGWYRCVMSWSAGATASRTHAITLENPSGTDTYTGDGYSGVFIWGAQLEAGAFPTSYIATTTTALTRNADAASMTGTNFSSWYNASEGTLFVEAEHPATTGTGKTHEYVSLFGSAGSGYDIRAFNGTIRYAVQGTSTTVGNDIVGAFGKVVMSYSEQTTFAQSGSLNGAAVASSTTSMTRTLNALSFGGGGGSNPLSGTIRRIAYYPIRATNAQLQALTG